METENTTTKEVQSIKPTDHATHQMKMEEQKMRKVYAREWHKNPNRTKKHPAITLK